MQITISLQYKHNKVGIHWFWYLVFFFHVLASSEEKKGIWGEADSILTSEGKHKAVIGQDLKNDWSESDQL